MIDPGWRNTWPQQRIVLIALVATPILTLQEWSLVDADVRTPLDGTAEDADAMGVLVRGVAAWVERTFYDGMELAYEALHPGIRVDVAALVRWGLRRCLDARRRQRRVSIVFDPALLASALAAARADGVSLSSWLQRLSRRDLDRRARARRS